MRGLLLLFGNLPPHLLDVGCRGILQHWGWRFVWINPICRGLVMQRTQRRGDDEERGDAEINLHLQIATDYALRFRSLVCKTCLRRVLTGNGCVGHGRTFRVNSIRFFPTSK